MNAQKKRGVKLFEGFVILLLMQSTGTFLSKYFDLILPGNLTGLLLLFTALLFRIIKLDQVEQAANLLLDNMMALFIPLNVGLITILPKIKEEWLAIMTSLLASTVIVMVVTAKAVELSERGAKNVK
ncbi:CidA/LrgA family protein [Phosphitispora sp. TUW77]|uniref:CidA/LrgA family protein n=1 Tax=Phosphitispora sp. TUW77 TaxID=3152361 RepID=UPI003AB31DD3